MKKKSRWLVAAGLVLALTLVLVPTQVMAEPDGAVDANGPYSVGVGDTFTVYIDVDYVDNLCAMQFEIEYDNTVINFVSAAKGDLWGALVPTILTSPPSIDRTRVICTYAAPMPWMGLTGGPGTLIEMTFTVVGAECDTSVLDLNPVGTEIVNQLSSCMLAVIPSTWTDSSVEVGPCATPTPVPTATPTPTPFNPVVVSGKPLPAGAAPVNGWVPPGPPPGFEECDEFHPCEWVWVWGYGFTECHTYKIWIQPYGPYGDMPDPSVVEGQELIEDLCPPRFPPVDPNDTPVPCPPGWEPGWVEVHIDAEGKFGPVPIWHVEGEYCELWEIVADMVDAEATNPGFYYPDEDGLDAAATDAWGFHIYPEGLTIILLSLGLVAVGGYLVVRRRKGAKTAS